MSFPQLFAALTPILAAVGTLLWYAFGLPLGASVLAGLGMALFPMLIVGVMAWRERRSRP